MFIFLDESGDLGFDWSKKCTSKYFTITILTCATKEAADGIRHAVKRTLRNKLNHKKSTRTIKELKGTSTNLTTKEYFHSNMPEDNWNIYSITIDKQKISTDLQLSHKKKELYNFLAHFIISKVPLENIERGHIDLIVDKCKNKEEIKEFNKYIKKELYGTLPSGIIL